MGKRHDATIPLDCGQPRIVHPQLADSGVGEAYNLISDHSENETMLRQGLEAKQESATMRICQLFAAMICDQLEKGD